MLLFIIKTIIITITYYYYLLLLLFLSASRRASAGAAAQTIIYYILNVIIIQVYSYNTILYCYNCYNSLFLFKITQFRFEVFLCYFISAKHMHPMRATNFNCYNSYNVIIYFGCNSCIDSRRASAEGGAAPLG